MKHKNRFFRGFSFEKQLTLLILLSSVPSLLLLLWTMLYTGISIWLCLLVLLIGSLLILYTSYQTYQKSTYQFLGLSNLLDGMIQGEYSLRARSTQSGGALDELIQSINGVAERLSQQRWESVESQLLVRTVIKHIDVAIIALNEQNKISFINPAAKNLLALNDSDSDTELLKQLAFVHSFSSGYHQVVELSLGRQQGKFNVHVEEFRESGLQHKLLFITDVRTLLRSEERKAWQSLVRVISHEINNSLSPIASISQTLNHLIKQQEKNSENNNNITEDLIEGLNIITQRANGLKHFVNSYKQLAKLPEPKKQLISITDLLNKTSGLFKHTQIVIETQNDVQLFIDPIQFEQVLINLFKNAVEAMQSTNANGVINVKWQASAPFFKLHICDQGSGISNPENLFVPFYSTKKNGSGIGLVLSRQIIEAHNGQLVIVNRTDTQGCCACIELPQYDGNQLGR